MPAIKLVVPKLVSLKDREDLSERWVEDQLVDNPAILGLGEVEIRGRQRNQPKAGRLNLLLEDTENKKRYEVELQSKSATRCAVHTAVEKPYASAPHASRRGS